MLTISTHNGSSVSREHNRRNEKVVSKEAHIRADGIHETWRDYSVKEAYHRIFDGAVAEYNARQKRKDRMISDYLKDIRNDSKKHPVYELVVGVYGEIDNQTCHSILREFAENWQVRNPSLALIGAYYHADEQGSKPHIHLDYVPVGRGYRNGMSIQSSLNKALENMGFETKGKNTAQIQWEKRENEYLERLCNARGYSVDHPMRGKEKVEHLDTNIYKLTQAESSLKAQYELLRGQYEGFKAEAVKEVQMVKEKFSEAQYELKRLEASKELAEIKVNALQGQIDTLMGQINALKGDNKKLLEENKALSSKVKELRENKVLSMTYEGVKQYMRDFKRYIANTYSDLTEAPKEAQKIVEEYNELENLMETHDIEYDE